MRKHAREPDRATWYTEQVYRTSSADDTFGPRAGRAEPVPDAG
jgi:hypothetical protein